MRRVYKVVAENKSLLKGVMEISVKGKLFCFIDLQMTLIVILQTILPKGIAINSTFINFLRRYSDIIEELQS